MCAAAAGVDDVCKMAPGPLPLWGVQLRSAQLCHASQPQADRSCLFVLTALADYPITLVYEDKDAFSQEGPHMIGGLS